MATRPYSPYDEDSPFRSTEYSRNRRDFGDEGTVVVKGEALWTPPQLPADANVLPPRAQRSSDEDRLATIEFLNRKHAEGYLDEKEHESRVKTAEGAKTRQELFRLEDDLPLSKHRAAAETVAAKAFGSAKGKDKFNSELRKYGFWFGSAVMLVIAGITCLTISQALQVVLPSTAMIVAGITLVITALVKLDHESSSSSS